MPIKCTKGEVIKGDFYTHLDHCKRCAEGPFDLCPIGEELLEREASKLIDRAYERADNICDPKIGIRGHI